jgi:myb proto-oncogene protein
MNEIKSDKIEEKSGWSLEPVLKRLFLSFLSDRRRKKLLNIAFSEGDHFPMQKGEATWLGSKPRRRCFRPDEDRILEQRVREFGTSSWDRVAVDLPDRTARQCRERWTHHLSMNKQDSPWTPQEDSIIWSMVQEIGSKWTRISSNLVCRSDYQVKCRWRFLCRRRRRICHRIESRQLGRGRRNFSDESVNDVRMANLHTDCQDAQFYEDLFNWQKCGDDIELYEWESIRADSEESDTGDVFGVLSRGNGLPIK